MKNMGFCKIHCPNERRGSITPSLVGAVQIGKGDSSINKNATSHQLITLFLNRFFIAKGAKKKC